MSASSSRSGDREPYARAAGEIAGELHFVEQKEPRGYGNALLTARDFIANEPFLHLVGDHPAISELAVNKAAARSNSSKSPPQDCAVSAVQSTRENMLPYFGTVGGRLVTKTDNSYEVETVLEKPIPTQAEQSLVVPGLRAGHYLCLFGMHVLTPAVMEILAQLDGQADRSAKVQLEGKRISLADHERYLALQVRGKLRYRREIRPAHRPSRPRARRRRAR